ncbi:MAG: hypothetical protein ACKOA8_05140 [Deltaproteobacteria bacterium]
MFWHLELSQKTMNTVKKHIALSIIMTFGLVCHYSLAIPKTNCRELLNLEAKRYQGIPTPMGMSQNQLNELIDIFKNNPDFSDVEAMVLFGSRTHFSYGYSPEQKSDLDVMFFFKNPPSPLVLLDRSDVLNKHLIPISKASGFPISQEIPSLITLKESIEIEVPNPPDFKRAQSIHSEMIEKAKSENWSRTQLKKAISAATHGMVTHRDKIILIRDSATSRSFKKQLQELGYTHVYLIPIQQSGSIPSN